MRASENAGEFLASGQRCERHRFAYGERNVERPALQNIPDVAQHVHFAVKRNERAAHAARLAARAGGCRQSLLSAPRRRGPLPLAAFAENEAAENSELLKGKTRLPSLLVPSANSTMLSPFASRSAISPAWSFTSVRRVRSTKTLRCSFASWLKKGHVPDFRLRHEANGRDGAQCRTCRARRYDWKLQKPASLYRYCLRHERECRTIRQTRPMIEARQRLGLLETELYQHILDQHQRQRYQLRKTARSTDARKLREHSHRPAVKNHSIHSLL